MKRAKFTVHDLAGQHVARFSKYEHAIEFARFASRSDSIIYACAGMLTVTEPRGVIGQFVDGGATREFAHLDAT